MKVELDSKVYVDLLEVLEYYDDESGAELAADFYSNFAGRLKEPVKGHIRFRRKKNCDV
jgi:hypothetical protein